MGIGLGVVLLVVGLILGFDVVNWPDSIDNAVNMSTLGWILGVMGVVTIILALVMNQQRSNTKHVEERRYDGH